MKEPVELGRRVKDKITGFTGIAIERVTYLHGCPQVNVCSEELDSGRPVVVSFDEPGLIYDNDEGEINGFKKE